MASSSEKRIAAYKFTAAVARGKVVKATTDPKFTVVSSAATDKHKGILQDDVSETSSGSGLYTVGEVAIQGGGAIGLAGTTIAEGDYLTSDSSGALIPTTTPGDRVCAKAMEAAVANDIFGVEVVDFLI